MDSASDTPTAEQITQQNKLFYARQKLTIAPLLNSIQYSE
jgi:hypothetical protein